MEFGKGLNFNETVPSVVFRMVLIASGLFFGWRRGRFSENLSDDSKKMFDKKRNVCIFFYWIWYFTKTIHCSKRFVLSSRQEITRKGEHNGGKTLTQRAQKKK